LKIEENIPILYAFHWKLRIAQPQSAKQWLKYSEHRDFARESYEKNKN